MGQSRSASSPPSSRMLPISTRRSRPHRRTERYQRPSQKAVQPVLRKLLKTESRISGLCPASKAVGLGPYVHGQACQTAVSHAGELFPRVGFIVTNTQFRNRRVVQFYL